MTDERDDPLARALLSLGRDVNRLRWSEAAAIRARGRQIARRTWLAASLAVLVALGLGTTTAWYALGWPVRAPLPGGARPSIVASSGSPTSSTTAATASSSPTASSPPTTPAPVATRGDLPVSVMLQPADLGADWRVEAEQLRGDLGLGLIGRVCWNEGQTPAAAHVTALRTRGLTNRPEAIPAAPDDPYLFVPVEVRQFDAGWASTFMREWRDRAQQVCHYDAQTQSLTVLETGFAGDESILFRFVGDNGYQAYVALVRRGELTALVDANPELPRDLVRTAAEASGGRLCTAAAC